jgi:hypothetical protein
VFVFVSFFDVTSNSMAFTAGRALSDTLTISSHPSPLSDRFDRSLDDSNADLVPSERPKKPRIRGYSCDSEMDEWDDTLKFECEGLDDSFDKLDLEDSSFLDDRFVSIRPMLGDTSSYPTVFWGIAAKSVSLSQPSY